MPNKLENPTNDKVASTIISQGYDLNPMKGTQGDFYRDSRAEDLFSLTREILQERQSEVYKTSNSDYRDSDVPASS